MLQAVKRKIQNTTIYSQKSYAEMILQLDAKLTLLVNILRTKPVALLLASIIAVLSVFYNLQSRQIQ